MAGLPILALAFPAAGYMLGSAAWRSPCAALLSILLSATALALPWQLAAWTHANPAWGLCAAVVGLGASAPFLIGTVAGLLDGRRRSRPAA